MSSNNFNTLLEFAIEQEQAAVDFYTDLASKVKEPHVRETLLEFAEQERRHKVKLQAIRTRPEVPKPSGKITDLQIGDYLVDIDPTPDLSFQGALIIAMKKEKAAYRMYQDLAAYSDDPELRDVFLFLAQEEANHKLSFEIQYDDIILQEN
ncbi:MAG: ferritin family protein [Deltaproteobacteria bacterium]|nr:ferritin family protein [Deltaproteobacteria bacterium]